MLKQLTGWLKRFAPEMAQRPPLALTSDHGVSRARRAIFAFIVTMSGILIITGLSVVKLPVSQDIILNAQHILGDLATFIGLAYISGSVVDYRSMMRTMADKYGVHVPMLDAATGQPQPDATPAPDPSPQPDAAPN